MEAGQQESVVGSPPVAPDVDPLGFVSVEDGDQVVDDLGLRVVLGLVGLVTAALPERVDRQHPEVLGQAVEVTKVTPAAGRMQAPGDQQQRRTVAGRQVVDLEAPGVDLHPGTGV